HERFLGNMLAGLGPAPVGCFVVAADEGWQEQSSDHRDAVAALGIDTGVLVRSRADRADAARVAEGVARAREELAGTGLADAPAVVTSAVTGAGLDRLREALAGVLSGAPAPDPGARVRLWVDRSFTIAGAGTVVTGTLAAGTVRTGDRLTVAGGPDSVAVRGLQSRGEACELIGPTDRVAVNLRGVEPQLVARGSALLTPDAWPETTVVDVRRCTGEAFGSSSGQVNVHVGTAALAGRLRRLDGEHARITLSHPAPVVLGDRLVLPSAGRRRVRAGGGRRRWVRGRHRCSTNRWRRRTCVTRWPGVVPCGWSSWCGSGWCPRARWHLRRGWWRPATGGWLEGPWSSGGHSWPSWW